MVEEVVGPRGDRHRHLGMAGSLINSRPLCDDHRRHLVNRYYDPATYQFLSIDPKVASTMQPYAFVGGDPLNDEDPLGLQGGPVCIRHHDVNRCFNKRQRARRGAFIHSLRRGFNTVRHTIAAGYNVIYNPVNDKLEATDGILNTAGAHVNSALNPVSSVVNKIPGASVVNNNASCIVGAVATAAAVVETGGGDAIFVGSRAAITLETSTNVAVGIGALIGCKGAPEPP